MTTLIVPSIGGIPNMTRGALAALGVPRRRHGIVLRDAAAKVVKANAALGRTMSTSWNPRAGGGMAAQPV